MKRILIIFSLLISAFCSFAFETKKVAILEVVDKENKLSYHQKLMLRSRLAEEINKSAGFEAYDRANIDAIMGEHNFQRTGLVSPDQIRQLGVMAGAAYVLVIEGAISSQGSLFVSANLLDVETAQMVVTENQSMASSESGLQQGCAALAGKLFGTLKAESDAFVQAEQEEKAKYYVYKTKKGYVYRESEMDKKAYVRFLKANCSPAYQQYQKGKKIKIAGWTVFSTGIAVVLGGAIYRGSIDKQHSTNENIISKMTIREQRLNEYEEQYKNYCNIGSAIIGVGCGIVATSIPIVCVGAAKQKKSMSIYNEQCSSPSIPPITFNITAGQNGIGLAINY